MRTILSEPLVEPFHLPLQAVEPVVHVTATINRDDGLGVATTGVSGADGGLVR